MKTKGILPILIAVLIFSLLSGCESKETTLTGTDMEAILAFSEAKTDNLLAGMNANDYASFSKDFDQALSNAMNQSKFDTFKKDKDAKLGAYVSRQVNSVTQSGAYYAVIYDTKFEKDNSVTMRVVFSTADAHEISGLWFNK
jgi:hypothetical protein